MATSKSKKTKGQEETKGYLVVSIRTSIRPDMECLMDDLDSDPENEYFNWLYEKNGSTKEIEFDCSEKLVDTLAAYGAEDDEDYDDMGYSLNETTLMEIGEKIGEEAFVKTVIDRCNDAAIQMYAEENYEETLFRRDWRDGINEITEIEDKDIRERWKELLKRNINKGLATDYYTPEEFKEECDNDLSPKNDKEWEEAYDKYIDDIVDDYYYSLDDEPNKEMHMKDSGLRTYDEANYPSFKQCMTAAREYCEWEDETWEVTDFGKK